MRLVFAIALASCTVPNQPGDPGQKMVNDAAAPGSDGGGNPPGSQCPCQKHSYCDLATQTCKPGCAQNSDCNANEECDTGTRTCHGVVLNDMGQVVSGACAKVANYMNG